MDDLIFQLSATSTETFVEQIRAADPDYLKQGIVPYLREGQFTGVIFGRILAERLEISQTWEESVEVIHPETGTFIDLAITQSFAHWVEYKAEFVPVFNSGQLLGLCDPHELRFWLRETGRHSDHVETNRAYLG
jgi:hypothetical protein